MKVVFFLVVLANIAFFMWEYNRNIAEQAAEQAEPPDIPVQQSIVLVDELTERPSVSREKDSVAEMASNQKSIEEKQAGSENKQIADLANENRSPQSEVAGYNLPSREEGAFCVEAGPFTDEKLMNQWSRQISAVQAQIQLQTRTMQSQSVADYLVYQPAAETPEQSDANLKLIKNQGFTDAWRINESEGKGRIVLGVFKKEERAMAMKEQLRTRGIYAGVMPRYKKQLQKYVLIKGQGQVPESITILQKNYSGITLKPATTCIEP